MNMCIYVYICVYIYIYIHITGGRGERHPACAAHLEVV